MLDAHGLSARFGCWDDHNVEGLLVTTKLIAVVNHIGGRLMITPERYRRGHYRLWGEPEPEVVIEDPPFPLFVGAGWWKLSNGRSVRGEAAARVEQSLLEVS